MQESAQAALSYIRGRAQALGLSREFYRNVDLHLHVPRGGSARDAASAGVAMSVCTPIAIGTPPQSTWPSVSAMITEYE